MDKSKSGRLLHVFLPVLFWAIVFSLPYFSGMDHFPKAFREQRLRSMLFNDSLLIVIFYVHSYVIYPIRERKHGVLIYILTLLACVSIYLILNSLWRPEFPINPAFLRGNRFHTGKLPFNYFRPLFPFCFVIAVSFCYQLYRDKIKREKIHLQTELDFLSSQISPHFMFNTLNTMVAMARKKSDKLETSLISLSQLMRYMLYEHNGKPINLAEEIEYLKSYINLQMIRFEDDVKVNLQLSGNFEGFTIAPMLLIPFIENAFKHGIGNMDQPEIDIAISIEENERLLKMCVINQIMPNETILEKSSGIGLNNVKRRLILMYPNRHLFSVQKKDDTFMAILEIGL